MSSVPEIIESARDAGFKARAEQWVALVVLVEERSAGDADRVAEHFAQAKRYPVWSPVDLVRYGPRIAIRGPGVLAELARLGIEQVGGAVGEVVEGIAEPILEVARLPVRVLQWLTDPGTVVRIVKVVGGGLLIVGGLYIAARGPVEQSAGRIVRVVAKGATP